MSDASQKSGRNGVERAAILLLTLGESEAAEILKHLGAKDVQRVGRSMAELANVSREEVRKVLGEFTSAVEMQTSLGVANEEYVRKVLVTALGEEKASSLMDRISLGGQRKGLDALKWMDSRQVAEMLPQRTSADHRYRSFLPGIRPGRRSAVQPAGHHALGAGDARGDARGYSAVGAG
jgi:flagellar motor switch protein FliG